MKITRKSLAEIFDNEIKWVNKRFGGGKRSGFTEQEILECERLWKEENSVCKV